MNQNQQGQQQGGQQQNEWVSVQPSNDNPKWEPEATEKNGFAFDPNNPPFLVGYYVKDRQIKSTFNDGFFTLSEIQTINPDKTFGPAVDVAQNVVLQDRLSKVKMGTFIKITYLGKQLKKGLPNQPWSKTNSFHIWDVAENINVMNLNELLGKTDPGNLNVTTNPQAQQSQQQQPAQNQQQSFNQNGQQQFHNQQQSSQQFTPAQQNNGSQSSFSNNQAQGHGGQQFANQQPQNNAQGAGVKFGNEVASANTFDDKRLPF